MHLPTEGIQKSLYLMKIMQESIKLVCGLWSLIILGITENLRKINIDFFNIKANKHSTFEIHFSVSFSN